MNLSNLLNLLNKSPGTQPTQQPQPKMEYTQSKNYYPREAIIESPPQAQNTNQNNSQHFSNNQNAFGGLDLQTLLPLISGMNGGQNPLLSMLKNGQNENPQSIISSLLGKNKRECDGSSQPHDINKNSQLNVENYKKISDLD